MKLRHLMVFLFVAGICFYSVNFPLNETHAVQFQKVGQIKVSRGWGSSTSSIFEEFWSYLFHGHGVKHRRDVYKAIEEDAENESYVEDPDPEPDYSLLPDDSPPRTKGGGQDDEDPLFDDNTPIDIKDPNPKGGGDTSPVPEPSTLLLMGVGSGLALLFKRKKR